MNPGMQKILEGKAVGNFLNDHELAICKWLWNKGPDKNDMVGHLKDFMPLMEIEEKYKAPGKHNDGEAKAYRWAQNSTRKLVDRGIVDRIDKGTYQVIRPIRLKNCIHKTEEWKALLSGTYSASQVHAALEPEYGTKAGVARKVGIDARRWSRLLEGSPPNDEEQKKINAAFKATQAPVPE